MRTAIALVIVIVALAWLHAAEGHDAQVPATPAGEATRYWLMISTPFNSHVFGFYRDSGCEKRVTPAWYETVRCIEAPPAQ